ncbi:MAG: hypothetical protein JW735_03050, partial [Prolixibacteraceae bacterium]|nr:hypothetical protein [Prolixibacteraceae bacterium]
MRSILEMTCQYIGAQSSFLAIMNRDKNMLSIEVAYGLSNSQISRGNYEVGEGIVGRVVEYKKPVVIREVSKSKLFLNKTKKASENKASEF